MQKTHKTVIFFTAILSMICIAQSSSAFNITAIALYEDDNGGTTIPTTTMAPATEMTLAFNIIQSSLKGLSITLYDSKETSRSACYNTDNQESASHCAWVEWKNNSGEELFTDIRPTQTTWSIDKPNSLISTTSQSRLVFTPSKSSHYTDTSDWSIYIEADNGTETRNKTLALNNTYYLELVVSKTAVGFEPGKKNTLNHHLAELESNGYDQTYIPLTIIANAPYSWKLKSTDFSGGSSIPVDNNTLGAALSDTPLSQTYINTTYLDIESAHPPATDSGDQKQLFLWLDYPSDPDTTYTGTLTFQAYITQDPATSTSEKTVSMSALTDNTKPTITVNSPGALAWTKEGHTVTYSLNLTDTLSGFMNSLSRQSCTVYFDNQKVSEVYVEKNPSYNYAKCIGSFTVPEAGNKNVNLNFTVSDIATNFAYDDTIWLQVDNSSLNIADVSLVSTAKPNDLDWHFLTSDTLRIVAHIKNAAGDTINSTVTSYLSIPGASVTVNSTSISSSSPYTLDSDGSLDIEYAFTGATVGPATLYINAIDQMNNTADYNHAFYITNHIESIHIVTNFTGKIYSEGENITIDIDTNSDTNPVYMANVTAALKDPLNNILATSKANTDPQGTSRFYFEMPKCPEEYYTLSVTGFSPLDITKTVSDTTTIDIEWLDITVDIDSDAYIDVNRSTGITVRGRVDYSMDPYNNSLVKDAAVTCFIRGPNNYNDTDTSIVNSTSGYFCDGLKNITKPGKYRFEISAEKSIDGFMIRGWNKNKYLTVINISDMDLTNIYTSQDDTDVGVINLSYPQILTVEQNDSVILRVIITNTGKKKLENMTFQVQSDILGMNFEGVISELESGHNLTLPVQIFSQDTSVGSYNVNIYLESSDGTNTSASFIFKVLHGSEGKMHIRTEYMLFETKLRKLRRNLNTILPSGDENIISLDNNLKRLERYLEDLNDAIDSDDYMSAGDIITDMDAMLSNQEELIDEQVTLHNDTTRRNIIISIIIMFLILLISLLYYMWLPDKSTDYKFGKQEKPVSKTKNRTVQKIKVFIENLKSRIKEDPRYNYHRKDRWSTS